MPALSTNALQTQIRKGQLQPVYLVVGDDERAKDDVAAAFAAAVPEDVQPFAFERVSALDVSPAAVVASARTLPFLGDRRVIVVTRAERWFTGKRKASAADAAEQGEERDEGPGDLQVLEEYLAAVSPTSTVVFIAADVNRTLRVVKALLKEAVVVECWGLKGDKDARVWPSEVVDRAGRIAAAELKRAGLTFDRRAIEPLLEHAGADIATLRGDLERLILYCHGRREVTVEDVQAVVSGASLVNDWGVVNAIERGDAREALRQLRIALEGGEVPYMTLGQIGWFVRNKLPQTAPPSRLEAAVDAVFRTDLAMKTSGGEPRVLLERLVVELCALAGGRPSMPVRRPYAGRR